MPPGLQIHLFLLLHNWASTIWKHRCNHQGASLIRRYDLKEYHPWGWKKAWQCELYLRSMWKKGLVVCNSSSCYSSLWAGNSFCENSPVQFSCSVVSDSLRPHESQHARPPCPSPTPGVHSDSGPLSQWCLPAISFSVVPFSSCPQSLPASESFPMSQFFVWGGQSTGVSALHHSFQRNPRADLL